MRRNIFIAILTSAIAVMLAACGGTTPTTNTANTNAPATANSNSPVETTKTASEPTTNNAPTISPVFKAYCDAWVKNDEAALRKVFSSDTIKDFETQMKAEKEKSLLKFIEDEKVSGTPCDASNEEINGDNAVAKLVSNKYPNGVKIQFVKENGEWKMTNRSPALDGMKPSANTSNAPKTAEKAPANTAPANKDAKK